MSNRERDRREQRRVPISRSGPTIPSATAASQKNSYVAATQKDKIGSARLTQVVSYHEPLTKQGLVKRSVRNTALIKNTLRFVGRAISQPSQQNNNYHNEMHDKHTKLVAALQRHGVQDKVIQKYVNDIGRLSLDKQHESLKKTLQVLNCKKRPDTNQSKGGGSRRFVPWCL